MGAGAVRAGRVGRRCLLRRAQGALLDVHRGLDDGGGQSEKPFNSKRLLFNSIPKKHGVNRKAFPLCHTCNFAVLCVTNQLRDGWMQAGAAVINAMHADVWDGCQDQLFVGLSDTLIGVGLVSPEP